MEETEKDFVYLKDCANIAEILTDNKKIKKSTVTIDVEGKDFERVLMEIEEFVKVRVDRTQKTVSLNINEVQYIFNKI